MKKAILTILIMSTFLCSCASQSTDTIFIHAVYLQENDNGVKISAICEKQGVSNGEYTTISETAENLKAAAENLRSKNKECYFATCRLIIIPIDAENSFIEHLAENLSDSNIFPTKSRIICSQNSNITDSLKSAYDIQNILELCKKNKTNTIKFLSLFMEGKLASLPSFSVNENGKAERNQNRTFVRKDINING